MPFFTSDLMATHEAIALVKKGMPFRSAYREVADRSRAVGVPLPVADVPLPNHLGAPGRPDWKALLSENTKTSRRSDSIGLALQGAWRKLTLQT